MRSQHQENGRKTPLAKVLDSAPTSPASIFSPSEYLNLLASARTRSLDERHKPFIVDSSFGHKNISVSIYKTSPKGCFVRKLGLGRDVSTAGMITLA
jgi:hypothetical protein